LYAIIKSPDFPHTKVGIGCLDCLPSYLIKIGVKRNDRVKERDEKKE
jgi:hypothetical protein